MKGSIQAAYLAHGSFLIGNTNVYSNEAGYVSVGYLEPRYRLERPAQILCGGHRNARGALRGMRQRAGCDDYARSRRRGPQRRGCRRIRLGPGVHVALCVVEHRRVSSPRLLSASPRRVSSPCLLTVSGRMRVFTEALDGVRKLQ